MSACMLVEKNTFLEFKAAMPMLRRSMSEAVSSASFGTTDCNSPCSISVRSIESSASTASVEVMPETTLIVRNIPNTWTQRTLLKYLFQMGFSECVDFLHAPVNFQRKTCIGYAFINFVSQELAEEFVAEFNGVTLQHLPNLSAEGAVTGFKPVSAKPLDIKAADMQGRDNHIRHIQPTVLTAADMAPEFQPIVFDTATGVEIDFMGLTNTVCFGQ